ncbi:uncharacterized protein Triagg1_10744 [Trichoderma aggressivum f. europaeum]|uniref:Glucose-methanol-choline oxidoreductase C-terminal domain-containing protein n=1 Tax=Trichoderma aggressivum f. europaeum TaxID=173218 RepID=A0AAE1I504_9HYPO|nr:hypothetical protein Triagg1_10744 [Trichoderma aggressivum f. europaeum]
MDKVSIVIGSGFTALTFIDEVLKHDEKKRTLCLERGDFWLPTHFQNIPEDLMREFPNSMIDASKQDEETSQIPSADSVEPAPLAVGPKSHTSTLRFNKFSVAGPLIGLHEKQRKLAEKGEGRPLELMINCTVTGLQKNDKGVARAIETNRGLLSWTNDDIKVVLCAGAVPNATLLLTSFEECRPSNGNVGKRLSGHVRTNITARIPREAIHWDDKNSLQLACTYLAGNDPNTHRQYHIGISAIHSPNPEADAEDAGRECPDYAAAATDGQLKGSEKHIVFVCSGLGELDEGNRKNCVKLNNTHDPASNVIVQYTLCPNDKKMWDTMDEAIYQTTEALSGNQPKAIEYWDDKPNTWVARKPSSESVRAPGVVHEASTAFVGRKQKGGSLDSLYRPHGIANVFVTGGAVFPTSGSWNPTMTMCAYAQDLARKLVYSPGLIPPSQDYEDPN